MSKPEALEDAYRSLRDSAVVATAPSFIYLSQPFQEICGRLVMVQNVPIRVAVGVRPAKDQKVTYKDRPVAYNLPSEREKNVASREAQRLDHEIVDDTAERIALRLSRAFPGEFRGIEITQVSEAGSGAVSLSSVTTMEARWLALAACLFKLYGKADIPDFERWTQLDWSADASNPIQSEVLGLFELARGFCLDNIKYGEIPIEPWPGAGLLSAFWRTTSPILFAPFDRPTNPTGIGFQAVQTGVAKEPRFALALVTTGLFRSYFTDLQSVVENCPVESSKSQGGNPEIVESWNERLRGKIAGLDRFLSSLDAATETGKVVQLFSELERIARRPASRKVFEEFCEWINKSYPLDQALSGVSVSQSVLDTASALKNTGEVQVVKRVSDLSGAGLLCFGPRKELPQRVRYAIQWINQTRLAQRQPSDPPPRPLDVQYVTSFQRVPESPFGRTKDFPPGLWVGSYQEFAKIIELEPQPQVPIVKPVQATTSQGQQSTVQPPTPSFVKAIENGKPVPRMPASQCAEQHYDFFVSLQDKIAYFLHEPYPLAKTPAQQDFLEIVASQSPGFVPVMVINDELSLRKPSKSGKEGRRDAKKLYWDIQRKSEGSFGQLFDWDNGLRPKGNWTVCVLVKRV